MTRAARPLDRLSKWPRVATKARAERPERGRSAFVASTGGHLSELFKLAPFLDGEWTTAQWISYDDPHGRSMLNGLGVFYAERIETRDVASVFQQIRPARHLLKRGSITQVFSTGGSLALPWMLAGRSLGLPCFYIECLGRVTGASLTGRVLEWVPGTALYTQHPGLVSRRWKYRWSVLDSYSHLARETPPGQGHQRPLRILVSTGTARSFPFDRLVERLDAIAPLDSEIVWQIGVSNAPTNARGPVHDLIPHAEMAALARWADLLVLHAGSGSVILALEAGKRPILVPRRERYKEHVDDHQIQIAQEVERRKLGWCRDASSLTVDDLMRAAGSNIAGCQ